MTGTLNLTANRQDTRKSFEKQALAKANNPTSRSNPLTSSVIDVSIGSDGCKSTHKQYSFAGRQAMRMASLFWQKRPWFIRTFRVFRDIGTLAKVASTPRYENWQL
jgi:hypothetical protein